MNRTRLIVAVAAGVYLIAVGLSIYTLVRGESNAERITRIERQPVQRCRDACRDEVVKRLAARLDGGKGAARPTDSRTPRGAEGGGGSSGSSPGSQPPPPSSGGGGPSGGGGGGTTPPPGPDPAPQPQPSDGPLRPALDNLTDTAQGAADTACDTASGIGVSAC